MYNFDLKAIFPEDLVFIDAQTKSRDEIFAFVAQKLKEKELIGDEPAVEIVNLLKTREDMTSTGIGKGIAVPHITLKSARRIFGCVVKSEQGIEWDAIDGKPVKLAVFLFAPDTHRQIYLQILAEVAQILNIPELLNKIVKAKKPNLIRQLITEGYRPNFFEKYSRAIYFIGGLILIFLLAKFGLGHVRLPELEIYQKLDYLKFNEPYWINKEIISMVLFFSMVIGTLLFFRYRVAFGAVALSLLLVFGVMDIETTVKFMSIPTILFIIAVMVLVKWFEAKGMFKFLVVKGLKYFFHSPLLLFGALMFFSAILAGLIDEVSAILITFGIAIEISRYTKISIVPFLLGLVMATNIGSAMTLIGNPIGIYLAFAGKLTFFDFLRNSTIISVSTVILVIFIILLFYRKKIGSGVKIDRKQIEDKIEIPEKKELVTASIVFAVFVVLIVFHSWLEHLLRVEERTVLLATVLAIVGFIVLREEERGRYFIEKGPDWWTVLYFMFLFANAACLEYTGVTAKLAHLLVQAANAMPFGFLGPLKESAGIMTLMLWSSGILSGFVDNLPIVAALVPVVKDLTTQGITGSNIFWWSLLIGGCFGGNLTMIGSTANLVAIGVYEKSYRKKFYFKEWIKIGFIVTIFSLIVANIILLVKLLLVK
ncbi:MAG: PTS sugar transporter subunit IIA [Candidatus Latescibacteria bacterium]|nr:PTS sugar transporter subunit IIA [Candidatus Latescibacterota bacterium]